MPLQICEFQNLSDYGADNEGLFKPPMWTVLKGIFKGLLLSHHFFSGIGLGTVLTLQGTFGAPYKFLPNTVPTKVNGRITKMTMLVTATYKSQTNKTSTTKNINIGC